MLHIKFKEMKKRSTCKPKGILFTHPLEMERGQKGTFQKVVTFSIKWKKRKTRSKWMYKIRHYIHICPSEVKGSNRKTNLQKIKHSQAHIPDATTPPPPPHTHTHTHTTSPLVWPGAWSSCGDSESYVRRGPNLVLFLVGEGIEDPNIALMGHYRPATETQLNK